ncbi:hypothetical protein GCM10011374_17270 [Kocuria dechangensis]|uniref:DUF2079 domain-containing protein n=1 Tax=Kocuria dechangensis TaxID=1176249 RepID=A0A917GSA4_9MICC|nr:DUF2079 domain-containing protein [Kocuria dechangensis]GGG54919.1 hypothetical protein GCM10011374_17270 [Kocuria dechangensis]
MSAAPHAVSTVLSTAAGAAPAPADRRARWTPLAVAALVLVLYLWWSLLQWHRWEVPSWDLGIFTQLARSYAAGDGPLVPIKGHGYNLLGDHFHPILVLLAPVYALFPSALTLVVVQDVLVAGSAWALTRSAVRGLGTAPGGALGLAYGLSFGLQAAVAVQFHEVAFALPLLALSLGALVEGRWTAAALWAAPVAFVKEDLGVTVAVLGLVLAWRAHREAGGDRRPVLLGLSLAAWGAAWSLLAVAVVLPALNPGGEFAYADRLDPGAALADPLGALVSLVVPAQKALTWLTVLLVGAGIALRSPLVLVALPTLLWRMLSPNHGYWGTEWHYSAVLMPVVLTALLDAVLRLRRDPRPGLRRLAGAGPWLALAVALLLVPGRPLADLADPAAYAADPRARTKAAVVAAVPAGASVGTDLTLMHHLVPTTTVHWLGNEGDPPPDYVVVDQLGATWGGNPPADVAGWAEQHYGAPYAVVRDEEHLVVARRQG